MTDTCSLSDTGVRLLSSTFSLPFSADMLHLDDMHLSPVALYEAPLARDLALLARKTDSCSLCA